MVRRHTLTSVLALALVMAGSLTMSAQMQGAQAPPAPKKPQAATAQTMAAPLNLNTATETQLETLPGIGPAVAARILEYRQKNGGFKKIEELMNVKGIGEKSFLKIKALITVAPSKNTDK